MTQRPGIDTKLVCKLADGAVGRCIGTAPDGHPPAQAQAPTRGAGLPQRTMPSANFSDPFVLTRTPYGDPLNCP